MVLLSAMGGVPNAGDMFRLECNISRAETLPPSTLLEVIWLGIGDNKIISVSNTSITGNTSSTTTTLYSRLTFPRITTSQGGRYSCAVSMTIFRVVMGHRVTNTWNVSVISKYAV